MVETEIVPVVKYPEMAGQHHWPIVKLTATLHSELALDLSYQTVWRFLWEQG